MTYAVATPEVLKDGEARLSELIRVLEPRGELELLVEHLHGAHAYLLGSMPREFAASMADARWAASQVKDAEFRKSLENAIDLLVEDMQRRDVSSEQFHQTLSKPQKSIPLIAESRLWNFFSTVDVSFGVFYPKNHIMVTFPSFEEAGAAAAALHHAGFSLQEAVAIRADEFLLFLVELKQHLGLWGQVMGEISRFFGTEGVFVKLDVLDATHGAGFLAVYCPPESECERVRQIIQPFKPVAMQRYLANGIQSL